MIIFPHLKRLRTRLEIASGVFFEVVAIVLYLFSLFQQKMEIGLGEKQGMTYLSLKIKQCSLLTIAIFSLKSIEYDGIF